MTCRIARGEAGGPCLRGVDGCESGSASVWVLAMTAVLLLAAASAGLYGAAVAARHRAATAADLASLAAAARLARQAQPTQPAQTGLATVGFDAAAVCAAAREVAERNGAALRGCVVDGRAVTVDVASPVQGLAGALGAKATARARAGPG